MNQKCEVGRLFHLSIVLYSSCGIIPQRMRWRKRRIICTGFVIARGVDGVVAFGVEPTIGGSRSLGDVIVGI